MCILTVAAFSQTRLFYLHKTGGIQIENS
jgi:hypothetical protein